MTHTGTVVQEETDQETSQEKELFLMLVVEALVFRLGGDVLISQQEIADAHRRESSWQQQGRYWLIQLLLKRPS